MLAVNAAFARVFGVSLPQELVGKTDFDIVPAYLAEAYRADDQHVLATRQIKVIEEKIPDGGIEKWFETFKAPLTDTRNEAIGTIGFGAGNHRAQAGREIAGRTTGQPAPAP